MRDISNVKQEIINFRKVIRPQRPVLRDLENVKQRFLAPDLDLEIYFDDIVDAHERIWDMLENYKEVVEALEDTNESVLTHRVNEILRVLTAISVIVLPLTLIASIWGMNVGVPGEGDRVRFYSCIGAMAGRSWSGCSPTSAARLALMAARPAAAGRLLSVNLGEPRESPTATGRPRTGIWKLPATGRIHATEQGLTGDSVAGQALPRRRRQGRLRLLARGLSLVVGAARSGARARTLRREPDHGGDRPARRAGR